MGTLLRTLLALGASLALVSAVACGGGEEATPTPTRAATTAPAATATATEAATPVEGTGTPAAVTLKIASVAPNPAKVGDKVTITFKTQPGNVIGLQITAPNGQIANQTQLTAGGDGTATLDQVVNAPGTWKVEAAAGRTVADLLALQLNPVPGPHSDDATFEVQ